MTSTFSRGVWFAASPRWRRIAGLAGPITAGALATQLMTLADALMVGQLGNDALAGVGLAGQLFFLWLAGLIGLSAGVQTLVARRVGQSRTREAGGILNAGITFATGAGVFLVSLGYLLLPGVLGAMNNHADVIESGLQYLQARLPSVLVIGINIAFRAYWIGIDQAKWSMLSIVTLALSNVLFNYALIYGHFGVPALGVYGAGLGSTLATVAGLLVNLVLALNYARANGFLSRWPAPGTLRQIVMLSYPESLRQILFSLGVAFTYVIVGYIHRDALAAFYVIVNICLIAYLPHLGFAGAATTLVAEALGRGDQRDAAVWGWQVATTGFAVLVVPSALVVILPQLILSAFLQDPSTMALAVLPLQIIMLAHLLEGYSKILGAALIGAGASSTVMRVTVVAQWWYLLPALSVVVLLGYSLEVAAGVLLSWGGLSAAWFAWLWRSHRWQDAQGSA